jgi:hypothetical protein
MNREIIDKIEGNKIPYSLNLIFLAQIIRPKLAIDAYH